MAPKETRGIVQHGARWTESLWFHVSSRRKATTRTKERAAGGGGGGGGEGGGVDFRRYKDVKQFGEQTGWPTETRVVMVPVAPWRQ